MMDAQRNPSSRLTDPLRRSAAERFAALIPHEGRKAAARLVNLELSAKVRFLVRVHRTTLYRWVRRYGITLPR